MSGRAERDLSLQAQERSDKTQVKPAAESEARQTRDVMTNREKLIAEIDALSDGALEDLLMSGWQQKDLGLTLCQDCRARVGEVYDYDCGIKDDDYDSCPGFDEWLHWPCRHERLLEVAE